LTFWVELRPSRIRILEIHRDKQKPQEGGSGTGVLQAIIITTGAQQREGRPLLDSEHLRHELVGYGRRGKRIGVRACTRIVVEQTG